VVFADMVEQPGDTHPLPHRAAHLGEEQIDAGLAKIAGQIAQHIGRADIEIGAQRGGRRVRSGLLRLPFRRADPDCSTT